MGEEEQYYNWKKSGQIPAFGNWDYANEMPITQYFDCARQAGLIRYSNSSGECGVVADLYAVDFNKARSGTCNNTTVTKKKKNRYPVPQLAEEKKHVITQKKKMMTAVVADPAKPQQQNKHRRVATAGCGGKEGKQPVAATIAVKPVDEDLYKIPSELIRTTRRKRRLGLFSRCLVPACLV